MGRNVCVLGISRVAPGSRRETEVDGGAGDLAMPALPVEEKPESLCFGCVCFALHF